MEVLTQGIGLVVALAVIAIVGVGVLIIKCYRKVDQGKAIVRNGMGGSQVSFGGIVVVPVIHRAELMDISVKRIEISRQGKDGLICKDNMRADIKVAFFVKVNKTVDDVLKVAQNIGCDRASNLATLNDLFESKFSEALKTVGKKFDFVDLYNARSEFKEEVQQVIGTDLNGYVLEDTAIDYLEQTQLEMLDPENILDSEGIKKITELTAAQKVLANQIQRDKERTLKKQDVEAQEQILELERQQAEAEERQKREVSTLKAREAAETMKIQQEERLKAEQARIATEEEVQISEENRQRQVLVASKNKDRTDAVETERVEKDRLLEVNERERIVELARIEKDRALEEERKNIQEIIRERVTVERSVVEEEEKIKDTQVTAEADRAKVVKLTEASAQIEEDAMRKVKEAEAARQAATSKAEQDVVEAEAERKASDLQAEARKRMAEAKAAEDASIGLAEAQVLEAKAAASERQGLAEATVLEKKALAEAKAIEVKADAKSKDGLVDADIISKKGLAQAEVAEQQARAEAKGLQAMVEAEAKGIEAKADAAQKKGEAEIIVLSKKGQAEAEVSERMAAAEAKGTELKALALEKEGEAEASVLQRKALAEALGIEKKAEAMKALDEAGRAHEEFKLELAVRKDVDLTNIRTQQQIADAQATVLQEALKSANIDIVGGDAAFFDKITGSITQGKAVDRLVSNSKVLGDVKETFFNSDPEYFKTQLKRFTGQFGMTSEDLKNLTLSALITRMLSMSKDPDQRGLLQQGLGLVQRLGLSDKPASDFI